MVEVMAVEQISKREVTSERSRRSSISCRMTMSKFNSYVLFHFCAFVSSTFFDSSL